MFQARQSTINAEQSTNIPLFRPLVLLACIAKVYPERKVNRGAAKEHIKRNSNGLDGAMMYGAAFADSMMMIAIERTKSIEWFLIHAKLIKYNLLTYFSVE